MLYRGAFVSEELLSLKPTPKSDSQEPVTFEGLKGINPDVKAWISVDGTHIDYPVVQGKTNLEYINKNIYGDFAFDGAIFLDTRNDPNFKDPYSLIYGHHMENGGMFGDLALFLDKNFFEENKTGALLTEEGEYKIDFFTVIQADGYDQNVFNPSNITNDQEKMEFLQYLKQKQVNSRDIKIEPEDRIIGLSTCTSVQTNGRTILYGILRLK